ncbi:MAG TPA: hypothetical protein VEC76_12775 [Streptosporangiaceae bacterium]|nr:hypothetical protein [Streptosporangiaceae bacterium]
MHPVIRQQLAAERVSYLIAQAERWRLARRARLARRSRLPRPVTPPGPPRAQAETERLSANTAALADPATGTLGPSADSGQDRELALAGRGEPEDHRAHSPERL